MEKKEVIKASGAIHVQGYAGLLQRKAWNVLLANSYDELAEKNTFEIKLTELESTLGFNSKDRAMLIDLIKALQDYKIEWNILSKEKSKVWGRAPMLGGVTISDGILKYSIDPILKPNLINPSMYARISLLIQKTLSSKYGLTIYEICIDYFDVSRGAGETPFIPIDQFRTLMGIGENEYPEFKALNVRTIKEPLKEINEKTDINIEVEYKKEKKKVIAIKFRIKRKPGASLAVPKKKKVPDLFSESLIEILKKFGMTDPIATDVVKNYDEDLIKSWIECLDGDFIPKVKNKPGYLLTALKNSFDLPPSYSSQKIKEESEIKYKEAQERRKNCKICKGEGGVIYEEVINGINYSFWRDCECVKAN